VERGQYRLVRKNRTTTSMDRKGGPHSGAAYQAKRAAAKLAKADRIMALPQSIAINKMTRPPTRAA
jgi:hypothetical protein